MIWPRGHAHAMKGHAMIWRMSPLLSCVQVSGSPVALNSSRITTSHVGKEPNITPSSDTPPFVDIHCHLLPEIDDGAVSWEETLEMARMAVADGISTIVATPHQLGNCAGNGGDAIRQKVADVQQFLQQHHVPLRVLPGADVRIEPDLIPKLRSGEVLTLADRRRYVLLELPHEVYLPLDGLLSKLAAAGIRGILTHPERNLGILGQPRVLEPLVTAGCLLQITAGALTGTFGPQIEKFATSLVQKRLVHFVATDAHGCRTRRPLLRRAFDRVAQLLGHEAAVDLCCRNPALAVEGRDVASLPLRPRQTGLSSWFRWNKAG